MQEMGVSMLNEAIEDGIVERYSPRRRGFQQAISPHARSETDLPPS